MTNQDIRRTSRRGEGEDFFHHPGAGKGGGLMDKLSPLAVSAAEAARLLGISRPTLYQLLNREDFPSFRVGNRVLVSVAGLQEWIDRQTKVVAQ